MIHGISLLLSAALAGGAPSRVSVPAAPPVVFTIDTPLAAGHHVLNVTNDAEQAHELVLVQLPPGKTIADMGNWVEKTMMKGPPPGKPVGGMAPLSKGRSGSFPIDLTPGRYGMICFLPDAKDAKTHVVHGMMKEFTVAAK